eukprot:366131-Chlamydomonas_euryale.AAC.31
MRPRCQRQTRSQFIVWTETLFPSANAPATAACPSSCAVAAGVGCFGMRRVECPRHPQPSGLCRTCHFNPTMSHPAARLAAAAAPFARAPAPFAPGAQHGEAVACWLRARAGVQTVVVPTHGALTWRRVPLSAKMPPPLLSFACAPADTGRYASAVAAHAAAQLARENIDMSLNARLSMMPPLPALLALLPRSLRRSLLGDPSGHEGGVLPAAGRPLRASEADTGTARCAARGRHGPMRSKGQAACRAGATLASGWRRRTEACDARSRESLKCIGDKHLPGLPRLPAEAGLPFRHAWLQPPHQR